MFYNAFAIAGRTLFDTLTRGDADALPRANRFWAVSPRVRRNKTMPLRSKLFSPRVKRNKTMSLRSKLFSPRVRNGKTMPLPPENYGIVTASFHSIVS